MLLYGSDDTFFAARTLRSVMADLVTLVLQATLLATRETPEGLAETLMTDTNKRIPIIETREVPPAVALARLRATTWEGHISGTPREGSLWWRFTNLVKRFFARMLSTILALLLKEPSLDSSE